MTDPPPELPILNHNSKVLYNELVCFINNSEDKINLRHNTAVIKDGLNNNYILINNNTSSIINNINDFSNKCCILFYA